MPLAVVCTKYMCLRMSLLQHCSCAPKVTQAPECVSVQDSSSTCLCDSKSNPLCAQLARLSTSGHLLRLMLYAHFSSWLPMHRRARLPQCRC